MQWNIPGEHGKCLTDSSLKIVGSHLSRVCRISQGEFTCRYITRTRFGFICVKNTTLKPFIDIEVNTNPKWRAKGNNCDGFHEKKESQKSNNEDTTHDS